MSGRSRLLRRLGVACFVIVVLFIASIYAARLLYGWQYSAGVVAFGIVVPAMAGALLFVTAGRYDVGDLPEETPDDADT